MGGLVLMVRRIGYLASGRLVRLREAKKSEEKYLLSHP